MRRLIVALALFWAVIGPANAEDRSQRFAVVVPEFPSDARLMGFDLKVKGGQVGPRGFVFATSRACAVRSRKVVWVRIVIPDDYQDIVPKLACFGLLRGHDVVCHRTPAADIDELVSRLQGADVVVAIRERVTFSRALLQRLGSLKLLALVGRHAKTIDFDACRELGIDVVMGRTASPVAPAELTVALMLASRRNVAREAARMQRGDWPDTLGHRLRGSTLGILGFGNIGALVAEAGRGLGMRVLAWGREGSRQRALAAGHEAAATREEMFERADVLSVHLRYGPETAGAVTGADLARMKPTALLVNTARAELLQPGALVAALRAGRPGYAAVDVYEEEPVRPGSDPLLGMENVLCTPHLGWAEWDTFELYFSETFKAMAEYLAR